MSYDALQFLKVQLLAKFGPGSGYSWDAGKPE